MTGGRRSKSMTLMMHTSTTLVPTMTVNLMDDDWTDSDSEREEEAEFNLVNPIVGEMYAYM